MLRRPDLEQSKNAVLKLRLRRISQKLCAFQQVVRRRSGYFSGAFSVCSLVLNGLEKQPLRLFWASQAHSTSHGLPYVVEVEYDGSAIFRQPPEMDLTPASNVLSHPFTGRL
jgi:hypothetical protein